MYHEDFEVAFLRTSGVFYETQAQQLVASCSFPEYLLQVCRAKVFDW